jgi:hypothetical protein
VRAKKDWRQLGRRGSNAAKPTAVIRGHRLFCWFCLRTTNEGGIEGGEERREREGRGSVRGCGRVEGEEGRRERERG